MMRSFAITAIVTMALALTAVYAGDAGKSAAPSSGPAKKTAAQKKAKPDPQTGPKTKISSSTATAVRDLPPLGEKDALAKLVKDGLEKWDLDLLSLRARFVQEFNFTEAGLRQYIEGMLYYKKPDLLKIEHIKPARQLVYTDKKDIWVYKPEDSQALKTSWSAWKTTQDNNLSGIMDFGNYAALAGKNNMSVSMDAAGQRILATLTPKDGSERYKLTLSLSATDYFPLEAELSVDKTVIRTRFESIEKNTTLSDDIFRFIPPKGTEVLEFKN